ncbi:MAG: CAP domain-containing protein [Terriglobales bacterium]
MLRALITVALVLGTGATPEQAKIKRAAAKSPDRAVASDYQPSPTYDEQAEQQLLEMANHARAQAGAPPLHFDEGLILAARAHAEAMARQQQLSHQFNGEPSLPHRLSAASPLHLDRAGENVALDTSVDQAHRHLMLSPPHRENLLDTSYNVAGFGVIRSGDHLYVVQDFGHSVPAYSTKETEDAIATAVSRARQAAHLPGLTRKSDGALREAVCSMGQEDRLGTRSMHDLAQRYFVLSYTNLHPEVLPASASRLIGDRNVRNMAVGACFARTGTYPGGVYWVGLLFY